jgi:hypothetical protein
MLKQLIEAICFRLINGPLGAPSTVEFHISKMELKPGDFLIARFKRQLSQQQAAGLRERLKDVLPNNKVLVFEGDVDLSVLAPVELKLVA